MKTPWIRRVKRGECGGVWFLGDSGWRVEKCPHPTALFPYTGHRPDGSMMLAPNGMAFMHLADAQAAVSLEACQAGVSISAMTRFTAGLDEERRMLATKASGQLTLF